jgi:hypothetical protein
MLAFERLEPFGALHAEFLAGQVCATLANLQRERGSHAYAAADFMPALAAAIGPAEPREFDNPEDQAAAIDRLLGLG